MRLLPGAISRDSRVSLLVERSALSTTHMPLTMTGVLAATAPPPFAKVAVPVTAARPAAATTAASPLAAVTCEAM
ncbi:MAG TPA: hypothetical protein VE861_13225 [Gemmatimonadaceae bacterium]|nr:hypothetical protein [Gemmatimonadaceae bacterium]